VLKSRILSGFIGAIILFIVVLSGALPLRIAVALTSMLMLVELFRAVNLRNILIFPSLLLVVFLSADILSSTMRETVIYLYLLIIFLILLLKHKSLHISDASLACLMTLYIGSFMGCITKIRITPAGAYWIWLIFIGAWVSDVFAYFTGKFFGKRKLIPSVSPKKTVAGAIGGALGAAFGFLIFGIFFGEKMGGIHVAGLFAAGIVIAFAGQLGDLVASVIKRQYGIKDYGKIMPGHGGAMDRFDSILFVAPVLFLYMQLVL